VKTVQSTRKEQLNFVFKFFKDFCNVPYDIKQ